ncbi:hypothetical protein [Emticicia sp. SJ17W-69]|uniref:hypothetical protein n=1 Tax=Emticicia sp. SJ17W-69 TaxID=3421657 RepID=UPI003EC01BBD
MRLIIEQINDQQKKAFMVVAKAMNVKVKVEKEITENSVVVEGFKKALKTMKKVEEGKAKSRPVEDLLNELESIRNK